MTATAATSYPLYWPLNKPRAARRTRSAFTATFARARDALLNELKLMNAQGLILSTNLRLRGDGLPLAGQRNPDDPGVAIYFRYKGRDVCFACDRWLKIEDNMQAIRHTIAALRGIARWGTGDMVDAAFAGFEALPAGKGRSWREVLLNPRNLFEAEDTYRQLARTAHPDRGGSEEAMKELNAALEAAKRELAG